MIARVIRTVAGWWLIAMVALLLVGLIFLGVSAFVLAPVPVKGAALMVVVTAAAILALW